MFAKNLNQFATAKAGRWLRNKTPLIIFMVLVFGFLSVPAIVGHVLTKGVPLSKGCATSTDDLLSVDKLRSGWELEREGRVESASAEYRAALSSRDNCVLSIALRELARISDFREQFGPAYRAIADTAEFAVHLQGPIIAALLILIIYRCATY